MDTPDAVIATPSDPSVETLVSSRHSISVGGVAFDYFANAGTVVVRSDDDNPLASMFYLSYIVETPEEAPRRPVTFFFNGGPGSASLWLNIGGFGPKRAPTATPRATPPAPYVVGDNPHTLLDESDLVFLDAVGTGYSRFIGDTATSEGWGVDQDVTLFARAITRYLTLTNNWNAPRFLFGESYGTTRAAALVHRLQNAGIDFNGVVLLSTDLNAGTNQPGLDQGYINLIPSFAATAWYHRRRDDHPAELAPFLETVRDFASGEYAAALQLGDRISAEQEDAVARTLSAMIGLDVDYLKQHRLRVEMEDFRRELMSDAGVIIGRFDTRFSADNLYIVGTGAADPATDDAATAGVNSAHLSTFREHVAGDIGFTSELHYRHLHNMAIAAEWDWHHKAPGIDSPLLVPNVALDLGAAMRRNPNLKTFVMGGVYDLSTPFFGAEFDISHIFLGPRLRENVTFAFYESGHMTFVDEEVVVMMKTDLQAFYASATHD